MFLNLRLSTKCPRKYHLYHGQSTFLLAQNIRSFANALKFATCRITVDGRLGKRLSKHKEKESLNAYVTDITVCTSAFMFDSKKKKNELFG